MTGWFNAALDSLPSEARLGDEELTCLSSHSMRDGAASAFNLFFGDPRNTVLRWFFNWKVDAKNPTPERVYIKIAGWSFPVEKPAAGFFFSHVGGAP